MPSKEHSPRKKKGMGGISFASSSFDPNPYLHDTSPPYQQMQHQQQQYQQQQPQQHPMNNNYDHEEIIFHNNRKVTQSTL